MKPAARYTVPHGALIADDEIDGGRRQALVVLEGAALLVVIEAQLGPDDETGTRLEGEAGGLLDVQAGEAGALPAVVVEELQPGGARQPRRELVVEVLGHAAPGGVADGPVGQGGVGLVADQRLQLV